MFLTVAEELHFGRAAARLYTAQPALSQAIKRLERELGVPLFTRTTRNVTLTGAGEVFFARVVEIFSALAAAEEDARNAHAGRLGTLRVGFTTLAPHHLLPYLSRSYHERFPNVCLHPEYIPSHQQVDRLSRGELDAGLLWRSTRVPSVSTDRIRYRLLMRQNLVAAIPLGHVLADEPVVELATLANEPMVTYLQVAGGSVIRSSVWWACSDAGFAPRIVQEAPDAYSIMWVVSAGVGISLLPECCSDMPIPGVVIVPLDVDESLDFSLGWSRDNPMNLLQGFIDTVLDLERESVESVSSLDNDVP
jgi:DNA-binding transcriptional LysR family regulator